MIKKIIVILLITLGIINFQGQTINAKTINNQEQEVYIQQLEVKNKMLIEAIDNLGARSKDEVIKLYSEGIKERSGAMQYSVMCKELKKEFIKTMDKEKNYAWVTGYSSPGVKNYEVIYDKKNKNNIYTVTVKFYWETASGPFNSTETSLTIKKDEGKWCIICIENEYH